MQTVPAPEQFEARFQLECKRCPHTWLRRDLTKLPVSCPSCHSPYWDKPLSTRGGRKRKAVKA